MTSAIPGLDALGKAFAYVLHWLSTIVAGNYGIAIILLTLLMRIAILPLSIKQTKSMIEMQKLQPQLKEIQKKYKDDREKMGQEMMALYKENKVSPLGGCLPLLLQLPIIFAVFDVLRSLSEPAKSSYVSIIGKNPNLSFLGMQISHNGQQLWHEGDFVQIVVLILLTVLTGYVSAKMMTTDPKQSKMMAMMPVVMGVFAWILPAGVTVYIIVTNIFTMIQQYVQLEHEGFFDQKLNDIRRQGDEAKWYSRTYLRLMDLGTASLVAVRLRQKPEPPKKPVEKKPSRQPGKAAAGKQAGGKKSGKAPSTAKKPAPAGGQKPGGGKKQTPAKGGTRPAAGKTASSKGYPAKKKRTGKK